MLTKICKRCAKSFTTYSKRQEYCTPCQPLRRADMVKANQEAKRRAAGKEIKITEVKCSACSKLFVRKSVQQHRCEPCQREDIQRWQREYKIRTYVPKRKSCKTCGVQLDTENRTKQYCTPCAKSRQKETVKAYQKAHPKPKVENTSDGIVVKTFNVARLW